MKDEQDLRRMFSNQRKTTQKKKEMEGDCFAFTTFFFFCFVVTDEASWNKHLQELLALFFFLVVLKDFLELFSGRAVILFG